MVLHVQAPSDRNDNFVTPRDLLVYCCLKKYSNKVDGIESTFVSLDRIAKEFKLSKKSIVKSLEHLELDNYIHIERRPGKSNQYVFDPYKNFEVFSYEFLDNPDLSSNLKSFLIAIQKYMFLSQESGKLSLSDQDIADKLHITRQTVINYNNELRDKGILTTVQNQTRDIITEGGCKTVTKIYDLKKYFQCIAYIIKNQQKQINENTQNINDLQQKYDKLEKVVNTVIKENKSLKKENYALKQIANMEYTKHYKDDMML